jgi:hypothetical protein
VISVALLIHMELSFGEKDDRKEAGEGVETRKLR